MGIIKVGVITVNDGCCLNDEVDLVGPELIQMINEGTLKRSEVIKACVVPEDVNKLKNKIKEWCDSDLLNLILTVGGAEGECVMRATLDVLERRLPGLSNIMTSVPIENCANLTCGFRGNTVIVNLPGSRAESKCCLKVLAQAIKYSIFLLTGQGSLS